MRFNPKKYMKRFEMSDEERELKRQEKYFKYGYKISEDEHRVRSLVRMVEHNKKSKNPYVLFWRERDEE